MSPRSAKPITRFWYGMDLAAYNRQVSDVPDQAHDQLQDTVGRAMHYGTTPRQQEILWMYYGQGLNTREIAQTLGVNQSTVSRTLNRGRDRVRYCMNFSGLAVDPEELTALRRKAVARRGRVPRKGWPSDGADDK